MPRVEVIVPWRPDCWHRQRAWQWIRTQWALTGWPVTEAVPPAGPWIKAYAINPATTASSADILIIADADVWTTNVHQAVNAVQDGAGWAIPHHSVHRLTEHGTTDLIAGKPLTDCQLAERIYRGVPGGGIIVTHRNTLLQVPFDPRFIGWGGEDHSWGYAMFCLHGKPWRGDTPLAHLWHPPQQRMTRKTGSIASDQLRRRYALARGNPDQMRDLLMEVTACEPVDATEPALHHHQAHRRRHP